LGREDDTANEASTSESGTETSENTNESDTADVSNETTDEVTEVEDEEVPLGVVEDDDLAEIEDEDVPLAAGVTMEGTKTSLVKWYMPAAIIVAVGALVDRIAQGRKKKAEKKVENYRKQMSRK